MTIQNLDVPVDISSVDFHNLMQAEFGEGTLNVQFFDNCYDYAWKVTWTGVGGDKNEMHITGENLLGDSVSYEVNIGQKTTMLQRNYGFFNKF